LSSQRTDAHPNQAHHPVRRQPFTLARVPAPRSSRAVRDRRVRYPIPGMAIEAHQRRIFRLGAPPSGPATVLQSAVSVPPCRAA